jgi:hypothetical protein
MKNLDLLIDQTFSYAVEQPELYKDDYNEFVSVRSHIRVGGIVSAIELIEEMDTLPREQVLVALQKDGMIAN